MQIDYLDFSFVWSPLDVNPLGQLQEQAHANLEPSVGMDKSLLVCRQNFSTTSLYDFDRFDSFQINPNLPSLWLIVVGLNFS